MLKRRMASTLHASEGGAGGLSAGVSTPVGRLARGIGTMNPPSVGRVTTGVRKAFPDRRRDR